MHSDEGQRRRGPSPALILAGLTLLALVLRFYRLGNWNFEATEIFTLRDSTSPQFGNPRPLIYLFNYYLVRPIAQLDEFGLRLLPAVFGVLAIPTIYLVCRRLVGTRAALFGALLLTLSALHVYYSQFARYWSLVFLLSAVYPFAIYVGLRDRDRGALALGILTGVLAVLAHPVSVLPVGGLGLWMLASYVRRDRLVRLWHQKAVRWIALSLAVLAVTIAVRFVPMLQDWIDKQDALRKAGRGGQFLLHLPGTPGVKQLAYLSAYVESLTAPLVLAAVLGVYLLWRKRDRPLALLLACLFIFHVGFLVLLSFRTPISTFYLVPATPIVFIGAAVFLDRLAEVDWELRPRWLLSASLTAVIIAASAPTLISQYRDGRRYNFRAAARWLSDRLTPGDVVLSDQPKVLTHYLRGTEAELLVADPAVLLKSARTLHKSGRGKALWVVAPAPSHAFRVNPKLGSMSEWLYDNCQLRNSIGVGRLDFRQNVLQIFRCLPSTHEDPKDPVSARLRAPLSGRPSPTAP